MRKTTERPGFDLPTPIPLVVVNRSPQPDRRPRKKGELEASNRTGPIARGPARLRVRLPRRTRIERTRTLRHTCERRALRHTPLVRPDSPRASSAGPENPPAESTAHDAGFPARMKNDRGAAATTSTNGPSQLADTAAITIPKIDVDSAAVKALLKTGMSESEEVLEYLGGNIASDLKAAAAKAATRRDLALGPKSKLDETAVNASMDELASRAKAVAPFWVGPGVDDTASPGSERATPARKRRVRRRP